MISTPAGTLGIVKEAEKILYSHLRNNLKVFRSVKFKKWFHKKYPDMDLHHLFGARGTGIKTSDYFAIPLTREQHGKAEKDKSLYAIENLCLCLNILQEYIQELESEK